MFVAMHNHNNLADPDQFATPASFETALAMSPLFNVTLDIGHFTAGNNDAVAFIRQHHDRIINIHVRDRKRNNGPNRPFGQGDTPIADVLRLIRDNRYPIRCYLEYEYGSFRLVARRSQDLLRVLQAHARVMTAIARGFAATSFLAAVVPDAHDWTSRWMRGRNATLAASGRRPRRSSEAGRRTS